MADTQPGPLERWVLAHSVVRENHCGMRHEACDHSPLEVSRTYDDLMAKLAEALRRHDLFIREPWDFEREFGKPEFEDSSISNEAYRKHLLHDPAAAALARYEEATK